MSGALLYLLDPVRAIPFTAGLLVLGSCLVVYYWRYIEAKDAEGRPNVTLALLFCNVLAFALGPITLSLPPWLPTGVTVAAVLLLAERGPLHRLAWNMPPSELITAAKFLILTGIVLPLLPREPVIPLVDIAPYQVWLAVVAVSAISYASYLLQRFVVGTNGGIWLALLGGLYSSTAATVALARNAGRTAATVRDARIGAGRRPHSSCRSRFGAGALHDKRWLCRWLVRGRPYRYSWASASTQPKRAPLAIR